MHTLFTFFIVSSWFNHRHEEIVPFFEFIENDEKIRGMMIDSSVSQTTLEEVFLNVSYRSMLHFRIFFSSNFTYLLHL